ncbi:MAG: thiol-disulfide oxidoreductase DCC family protein [Cytophagales bacterium]|nr:thiol-disulfide oxidoreductase DCC family protein [Cytophagales bacterium]
MSFPILLFDGECNLCNGAVQFVLTHEQDNRIRFASLQSATGQQLLERFGLPTRTYESFVLVDGDRYFTESTAALRVTRYLKGGWKWLHAFIVVPKPVRDWVYRIVARNRYRWFGRQESCWLPTPEFSGRFLA